MAWASRVRLAVETAEHNGSVWTVVPNVEVQSLNIRRGRAGMLQRVSPGTASGVLVYRSPTGGKWSFRPTCPLQLGMEVRFLFSVDFGAWQSLYRGAVRDISDVWDAGSGSLRLQFALIDRLAELAAVNPPAEANPVDAGDLVHERLARIADKAGIPAGLYGFSTSTVTLGPTTYARNLLDEAQVSAESDPGAVYVDEAGVIRSLAREWYLVKTRSINVQVTWANDGSGDVAPDAFATSSNLDEIVNQVSMARSGGTAQTVRDQTSIDAYGLRTHQRFDLMNDDDLDVEQVAIYSLIQLARRTHHLDGLAVELHAGLSAAVLEKLAGMRLHDLHALTWEDGSASPFEAEYLVIGLTHIISATRWQVSPQLWDHTSDLPTEGWGLSEWDVDDWAA